MSALTIIQRVCQRLALALPPAAVTSTDQQTLQLLALLNEEGEELSERYPWQALNAEATFTSVATESQGALSTLASGFKYVINDTMWNRTGTRPVFGPLSPQGWQQRKSSSVTGPYSEYRIVGNALKFIPVPAAGLTVAFEYHSKNWVTLAAGGTASAIAADADTALLDEQIMTMGLVWRFKHAKGFAYDEDFNKYERRVVDAMSRDGSKPVLSAGGGGGRLGGIVVPEGSWPL